jgi:hypothetical protein
VVKGPSAWGLVGYLGKNGAESGHILILQIDWKDKVTLAQVGDERLLDELASDSSPDIERFGSTRP